MKATFRYLPAALALIFASSVSAADSACTGHASDYKLYVDVQGVRSSNGLVAVTLYADDSTKFLAHHGSLYVGRVPAQMGTTSVCIHVPRTGVYAVAVYHDANANRRYDRTSLGLPDEGYGFSNNPPVFLGMPAWKGVRLTVPKTDTRTRIKLRYP